jgi:hypothetical protein
MDVQRVEIDQDGHIVLSSSTGAPKAADALDKWLEDHPHARPA